MGRLADRVALVTGGASGIGRAVVERFAAEGARVVSLDRQGAHSESATPVIQVVGDVREPEDHARAVGVALDRFGCLDILVANAGIHDGGVGIDGLTPNGLDALVEEVLAVNVRGYINAIRAAADALRSSHGRVVLTLSDASYVGGGTGAGVAYTSSKHATLGVLRALAYQLAPEVQVNGVAPGGVLTGLRAIGPNDAEGRPFFQDPEAVERSVRAMNPLRVLLRPEELAGHYLYLASEESVGMTGEVLRPDGGLSLT